MVQSPIADWFAYSFCGECWSLFRSVSGKDRSAVGDRPRQQLEYRLRHGCLAERKQRRSDATPTPDSVEMIANALALCQFMALPDKTREEDALLFGKRSLCMSGV
ncbi:hypothetical protein NL676_035307 [Syzygium grande]|nr:hypothetical protein NL676_035307 [Syzygium grande]